MNFLQKFFSIHRVPHKHISPPSNLNYDYVDDGIYVGTNQCCSVGLSDVLKKEGITADISLEEQKIDQPFGVEVYLWLPTPDHFPLEPERLAVGVATLEKLVAQKKKVYVHCQKGHGRSTTLVAAYLMKNKGMTLDQAFNFIKSKRPGVHMEEGQKKAVQEFAEKYKN